MARIFSVLIAFCVVVSCLAGDSSYGEQPLLLRGSVYCDTCRCGFETPSSTRIAGATVRVECRSRKTSEITYTNMATTDSSGEYEIRVENDRGDDYCDTVLVNSPDPECNKPSSGRDRARVILTRDNGMISNDRFANAMGFMKNTPLANCAQILQVYQEV